MNIRLPDRRNVANHFRPQAFLSEQSFISFFVSIIHYNKVS